MSDVSSALESPGRHLSGGGLADVDRPKVTADQLIAKLDRIETQTFFDPDGVIDRAVEIEQAASDLDVAEIHFRAQLVQADAMIRTGKTASGGRIAREINRWASEGGHGYLLARSHRVLSLFFSYLGDHGESLQHAVRALELLDDTAPSTSRIDHLIGLATALAESRAIDDARSRLAAAGQIAEVLGDVRWRLAVLNAEAWIASDNLELPLSLERARRMQALAAAHGVALQAPELVTLATSLSMDGQYAEAEEILRPVLDGNVLSGEGNGLAYGLLVTATSQSLRGDTTNALKNLERCRDLCDERQLGKIKVRVERQVASLYALQGRFEEAYRQHVVYHEGYEALQSTERIARAQTVQAVFETTEARRESQRFEHMALHDSLTGLYNRRFVDDRLPILLRRSTENGIPLTIGLVDLDHFKKINDTFSHRVGDEVLTIVASLLQASVPEGTFVARIGGEEFLIVMPDIDTEMARDCFESLRNKVRLQSWDAVAPIGRITISIGTSTAEAGAPITQSDLLGQADHNLYRAKRGGRDRVVADRD